MRSRKSPDLGRPLGRAGVAHMFCCWHRSCVFSRSRLGECNAHWSPPQCDVAAAQSLTRGRLVVNRFAISQDYANAAESRLERRLEFLRQVWRYAGASRCRAVYGSRWRRKAVRYRSIDCSRVALERPSLFSDLQAIMRWLESRATLKFG
jgi:hypothetical protein